MRLLIVEDDKEISTLLKNNLQTQGFSVDTTTNGTEGSYLARTNEYDAILLDFGLPEKRGDQICREIRDAGKTSPIIMLSVHSAIPAKIELLNMGADDYITKPFSYEELLARLRAIMRRPMQVQNSVLSLDTLSVDTLKCTVYRNEKEIQLTRKEFGLLEFLMRNKGAVVSRGAIMEHVWDLNGDIFSNTIETHISNLRRKIDLPGYKKLIYTVSGRGYKIDIKN